MNDVLATDRVSADRLRVAYMMSRFPKITETFVLYEMLEMQRQGVEVDVYPLWREPADVVHPDAIPFVQRACFQPFLSTSIVVANLRQFCRQPWNYLSTFLIALWAALGSLRYTFGVLAIFPKAAYFARRMQQADVDHIHAHFASHPAAAAFIIHRLSGIPYSFTAHGSDLHRDRTMLRKKVTAAAFVVAISQYNRKLISEECGAACQSKVRVIHCGVDANEFAGGDGQSPRECESGKVNVVCTGTMHEVKGQKYLIEACRHLRDRDISFHLHFIGDGPQLSERREQTERSGLGDHITFHGRKSRPEVIRILRDADIVAAPSVPTRDGRREGIPVVLIEAMASGIAVVASRLSGIPELVEHQQCGLLIPPGDSRALADALERLCTEPDLRRRLGQAGRRRVVEHFSQARGVELLLEQILSGLQTTATTSQQETRPLASLAEVGS